MNHVRISMPLPELFWFAVIVAALAILGFVLLSTLPRHRS